MLRIHLLILYHCCQLSLLSVTTPDEDILAQEFPLSYKQCADECKARLKCVSAKYFLPYKLCKLYAAQQIRGAGFDVYSKPEELIQSHLDEYTVCGGGGWDSLSTCVPVSCPTPPYVFGADVLGNDYKIDSKIKYQCRNIEDSQISKCTSNGTWTRVTLTCNCKASAKFDFIEVDRNDTHIFTERYCDSGTDVIQNEYQTCDLSSGKWTIPGASCCETQQKSWIKIFEYGVDNSAGPLKFWKSGKSSDQFRSSIIDNWTQFKITRLNFEVIKNGVVVAFMLFNGCDSDKMNWFSRSRLLNSSWEDLHYGTELQELSIEGERLGVRRFYVSKFYGSEENSELDTGWFVTAADYYLCTNKLSLTDRCLLYSPYSTAGKFYNMSYADRFVVSIMGEV